jgi:hypothetical protein
MCTSPRGAWNPESHTRCVKSLELLLEEISQGFEDSPLHQTPYLAKWQVGQNWQTAMYSDPIPSLEMVKGSLR